MQKFLMMGVLAAGLMAAQPVWAEEATAPQPGPMGQMRQGQMGQGQMGQMGQMGQGGGRHAQMMQMIDKDGDGVISKAEFLAGAEARFVRMDKNGDGRLTPDERPQRRERGGPGQGGPGQGGPGQGGQGQGGPGNGTVPPPPADDDAE